MRRYAKQCSLIVLLLGFTLIFSGCLKTEITTGKAASNRASNKAEIGWAHGFIDGLVPPINAPLNTKDKCGKAGVAKVDFRQTFVQGFVAGLTDLGNIASLFTGTPVTGGFSIYTPQRIQATCASRKSTTSSVRPPEYLLQEKETSR